jgi:hypothetical protein
MDLESLVTIKEPESTRTDEAHVLESGSTHRDEDTVRRSPPEHLRLDVLMTFSGNMTSLTASEIGVIAEGDRIETAFRRLIESTRERLASSEGARDALLDYPPYTWFRFRPPGQTTYADEATLADGFISALNELYEFKGNLVESFLRENPSLSGLLFGAYGAIHQYFGSEVKAALEVVADPEALGDRQLFVLIRTKLSRKEARVHLAELDRGWWLGALPQAEGKMEIALD